MRLFSSHLTDDSRNNVFGSAVNTITSAIQVGKDFLGLEADMQNTDSLEVSQKSIIHQAEDMLKNDTLTEFYNHNKPNLSNEDIFEINTPDEYDFINGSNEFNLPQYAINNYNLRVAAPIFARSDTERNVTATLTHGRLSMFNPYIYLNDYTGAYRGTMHFRDTQFKVKDRLSSYAENPTIKTLVEHPVGSSRYFYEDFAYCAELGKLSNNHLITLRKFAAPINDNIFLGTKYEKPFPNDDNSNSRTEFPPDIARMVCWFGGDDNKLEDIINMSFHASWKDMTGEWQEVDTGTDNESSGFLGILSSLTSSNFIDGFVNGTNNLPIKGKILGMNAQNRLRDKYRKVAYEQYDQKKKIYTPKDIIRDTKYYEGIMKFNNKFTLTFRYKMRSFNDLNQKMAFLDLLSNILNVTYRRATWWGGGVNWIGTPQNQRPFKIANALIDKTFDKAEGLWSALFKKNGDWSLFEALRSMDLGQLMSKMVEGIKSTYNEIMNTSKSTSNQIMGSDDDDDEDEDEEEKKEDNSPLGKLLRDAGKYGTRILKGAVKNQLGRPQIYALNSILNGAATGFWHVTVGNPFNPIVVMGNMVITGVQMYQTGPLTIDDFPEELVVKITLEHGKPRDITTLSKMYTRGYGELYTSPSGKAKTQNDKSNNTHYKKHTVNKKTK